MGQVIFVQMRERGQIIQSHFFAVMMIDVIFDLCAFAGNIRDTSGGKLAVCHPSDFQKKCVQQILAYLFRCRFVAVRLSQDHFEERQYIRLIGMKTGDLTSVLGKGGILRVLPGVIRKIKQQIIDSECNIRKRMFIR